MTIEAAQDPHPSFPSSVRRSAEDYQTTEATLASESENSKDM
jgi:hypothetical protein